MKEFDLRFTDAEKERYNRDLAIYNEYNRLVAEGGRKTKINAFLMEKYNIKAEGTLYTIRKRVEERLKREEAQV